MYSSGLVRGSVAFALIQYLQSIAQSDEEFNKDTMSDLSIISSTIMLLIIGTNLLSGVLMPFIARYSFKRIEEVGMTE
jgi:NhaP-type Na+/H+ or K+/H+ antiporter